VTYSGKDPINKKGLGERRGGGKDFPPNYIVMMGIEMSLVPSTFDDIVGKRSYK